ncbi:MAG: MlaA family lipoprotein [Candidatus Binatia bacterium]
MKSAILVGALVFALVPVSLRAQEPAIPGEQPAAPAEDPAPPPAPAGGPVIVGAPAEGLVAETTPSAAVFEEQDPWQGVNRKVFWFNDQLDVYVLEPVATGYDWVVPDRAQTSVANFFRNVRFPVVLGNDLLQGKMNAAATEVGRFFVNTTVGVVGLFDPATGWGLVSPEEDFGQTLGWWGAGTGPYLVLPILGPSTIRDGAGILVDVPMSVAPFFVNSYILYGARVLEVVNYRAQVLDTAAQAKEASVDYYTFMRNAYLQRREALVNDQTTPATTETRSANEEDLYFPE